MANLPPRPLEHDRFLKKRFANELLAQKTLEVWGEIFGWTPAQPTQSQPNAAKSKSKRAKR